MPTDAAVAKFLYTIMKQLNLKSIDWDAVAKELQITNGHAARMRYSRFKQQMEGPTTPTRKPRASGPRKRKQKGDEAPKPKKKAKKDDESQPEDGKSEDAQAMGSSEPATPSLKIEPTEPTEPTDLPDPSIKREVEVKQEPAESGLNIVTLAPTNNETSTGKLPVMGSSPDPLPDFFSTEEELQASAMIDPALTASAAIDPALMASVAIDEKEAETKIETELGY
ncbi:MAG: hypothetical protein Q9211_006124 [Gyalolechia sp. 1 TL-2023]